MTSNSELCAYPPCKCFVPPGDLFCGDACAMLGASLVGNVRVSSRVPLKPEATVPKCACGHPTCGDSQVSGEVH